MYKVIMHFRPALTTSARRIALNLLSGLLTMLSAQNVSFNRTDVPVASGLALVSVTTGDFNGDGKPDVAVVTRNGVSLLAGNGDGTFQSPMSFSADTDPYAVASGDFNGDGKLDLVVTNNSAATVSILLGNGDGTFLPAVNYSVANSPIAVAVGDFNNDGKPDLAVGDVVVNLAGTSILLGNGDGTFRTGNRVALPDVGQVRAVVTGDFNNDGNLDLATANLSSAMPVSLVLGNGDGTFRIPIEPAGLSEAAGIAIGDFNGDGRLDLAVPWERNLSILKGNGDGTFQSATNYTINSQPLAAVVGDFNGDGNPDLAIAFDGGVVSVLSGNPDGTFQQASDFGVGGPAVWLAIGDFNLDRRLDLVSSNDGAATLSILLNTTPVIQHGPLSPLYLTGIAVRSSIPLRGCSIFPPGGAVNVNEIFMIQGPNVVNSWATHTAGASGDPCLQGGSEAPLAVGSNIRTTGLNNYANGGDPAGSEYTTTGTYTGVNFINSLVGQAENLSDGTRDSTHNYAISTSGKIYSFDLTWQNPVLMFTLPPLTASDLWTGIAYDSSNNSLWVANWPISTIENFSLNGVLLSSFVALHQPTGLALDPADQTLWAYYFDPGGTLKQYSKSGVLLSTQHYAALSNFDPSNPYFNVAGAEFAFLAPLNHPPNAGSQSISTPANTPILITLTGADADNDPLTFAIVTPPTHGSLTGTPPNVTYTANLNYTGGDGFTFTVNDGKASSSPSSVGITVLKSTPVLTWTNPADIQYGTALSSTQLAATASVPGTFVYSPAAGTVLNAGSGQTLSVTFTPTDTATYTTASKSVAINVLGGIANTPAGTVVVVKPVDGAGATPVTLTFSRVNQTGTTTLTSGPGNPPPTGYRVGSPATFFQLATTAAYSGSISVCISYAGVVFESPLQLNLFHFQGGDWVNVTTSLDTVTRIVCGAVTSLSPFAIFERVNPDLTIIKTHSGNFKQGDIGDSYTITVSNARNTNATKGVVTVSDVLPAGLTATSIRGTGWSCSQPAGPCTRNDALAAGASYPTITLRVSVAANAPASVTNSATVSGGGELNSANDTASDVTTIVQRVRVTVQTATPGLSFTVDSDRFAGVQTFQWIQGSPHTISTASPQAGGPGRQYVWANWSDGGAISHTVTTPASAITYTATFLPQFLLTTVAAPAGGGTVSGAGFYNAGDTASVKATANAGYTFAFFKGVTSVPGVNPGSVLMSAPASVAANFVIPTITSTSLWIGLTDSDDMGIRFDLRAEAYRNSTQLIGSGELTSVAGGSSGFNNSHQYGINLTPIPRANFSPGDTLSLTLYVRNACAGSGKNSGRARLWLNDPAANSRFAATVGSWSTYYLLGGFTFGSAPGVGAKQTIDTEAGAKCSPYKKIGTWSKTLPF